MIEGNANGKDFMDKNKQQQNVGGGIRYLYQRKA